MFKYEYLCFNIRLKNRNKLIIFTLLTLTKPTCMNKGFTLPEDWSIVVTGFLIIALVIFGFPLISPTYGWKSTSELTENIFTSYNLKIALHLFICLFVLAKGSLASRKFKVIRSGDDFFKMGTKKIKLLQLPYSIPFQNFQRFKKQRAV
jgi:hypothetical protein